MAAWPDAVSIIILTLPNLTGHTHQNKIVAPPLVINKNRDKPIRLHLKCLYVDGVCSISGTDCWFAQNEQLNQFQFETGLY
jgi:hypothetical protein